MRSTQASTAGKAAVVLAGLFAILPSAPAGKGSGAPYPEPSQPEISSRIFVDAQTGAARLPTQKEMQTLAQRSVVPNASRSSGPRVESRDGMTLLYLSASSRSMLSARRGPNGEFIIGHGARGHHE